MVWEQFRELTTKEQNEIMDNYEGYREYELKHLKDSYYVNSEVYKQEESRLINLSLNDYLDLLKYNEDMGIWELKE